MIMRERVKNQGATVMADNQLADGHNIQKNINVKKVYFLGVFLSRSFEIGGRITKLLNQFDD